MNSGARCTARLRLADGSFVAGSATDPTAQADFFAAADDRAVSPLNALPATAETDAALAATEGATIT
ncbi:hypothetical protein OG264_39385 (plasmid) [Streptomyces xanthophaeus]|uniref:hypothetical protein n=1 Tax=Streptomyces xanthophaeus TaxID=67385 RepID=UPI002F9109AE|nr:hypothetical protein OG264_39385 [Streptomyces xanthophaeus]WST65944.1 hypothetical protein OG605_40605 [Streptomyces xanthophaeus]